jgi:predicted AlkP superfamily pyrophosphatase or phosphodiesterase
VAALLAVGCRRTAAAPAAPLPPATVVLVSFDGLRADYLDRALPLPAFARLAARGVRARGLIPSWPSKTFPNHWTLVTGLRPGRHGIVANAFWDPARGAGYRIADTAAVRDASWYRGTPLWALAERAGVRTAAVFWPGSEAPVGGVRPSRWMVYDRGVSDAARVDTVAAWLRSPAAERPRLVTLYVSVADDSGHARGPDAAAVDRAVVAADRTLGRLLDSLDTGPVGDRANVVVVSDHGMRAVSAERVVDLSRCAGQAAWAEARPGDPGPVLALWWTGAAAVRAREARRALPALQACLRTGGHARALLRAHAPESWAVRREPRAGDLIVAAEPGWLVYARSPRDSVRGGAHGWDPADDAEMRGVFLAAGPHVRGRGALPPLDNVLVAPLLARLLGLPRPPHGDADRAELRRLTGRVLGGRP